MKKNIWKHIVVVVIMLATALLYFAPAVPKKMAVRQGDTQKYEAMVKETKDYHKATGEYAHWNSAMFSGMPAYQVGGNPPVKSIFTPIKNLFTLEFLDLQQNAGVLFFYLIGFYIALVALGCSPWLALFGSLAFGLGSYNIIIIEAGHITKAWSLAMTAPILAGMVLCLRKPKENTKKWKDLLWGGLLFTFALGLQLLCNHIQITYYTIIGALLLGLTYLINALIQRYFPRFITGVGVLILGCILAFACNARTLMVSQQYASQTMRGGNAITVTPQDLYHDNQPHPTSGKTSGLDINYAFQWSYGIGETYTLIVPGAMGGGSLEPARNNSNYAHLINSQRGLSTRDKALYKDSAPYYWGNQPFTSGPVYFGAIICFLFILGTILVRGPEKWWLLAATIIAILMSWGSNFMPLNQWLFNHLPLYNKFRTPSMSLVLANVAAVIMSALGLKQLLSNQINQKRKLIALIVAGGVTTLILLIGIIVSQSFNFIGLNDTQFDQSIKPLLIEDRKHIFINDSLRSLLLIILAFAILFITLKLHKWKGSPILCCSLLALLTVIDLWGVDRRYLNNNKYVSNFVKTRDLALKPDPWDSQIDQLAAQFGDKDYRVINLATNTFNDSKPAAFHHQIGGYSAVKMRRYQDIIDFYLSSHINPQILNMLNARYIVTNNSQVLRNPDALGNCWFVQNIIPVNNANTEILTLNNINPAQTAIIDTSLFNINTLIYNQDTSDIITIEHQTPYNPDYLRYHSHTQNSRLALFSEIYYEPDWRAYIDGKPAPYIRANYVLRAMVIPAGDHTIEFRNEAPLFHRMDKLTLIASILLLLLSAAAIILCYTLDSRKESLPTKK